MNFNSRAPLFSIVITTYNRAGLLQRALDSLICQIESSWEALIIDDGSTDNTSAVVRNYLNEYQNLTYVFQANRGFINAKNRGISLSRGQYISFLDSDDEYRPNHLKSRKNILLEHKNISLLHGGVKIIGNPFVPDRLNPGETIHISECAVSGTFFIKRNLLTQLKGFGSDTLNTDAEFLKRAKRTRHKTFKITGPETYVYHHETPGSLTNRLKV